MMITTHLKMGSGDAGFGFNLRNAHPCRLSIVAGGLAETNGLKDGDVVAALDGVRLENAEHLKVANHLRKALKKREVLLTVQREECSTTNSFNSTTRASPNAVGMSAGRGTGNRGFPTPLKNANGHRYAVRSKFATLRPSPRPKSNAEDGRIFPMLRRGLRRKSVDPARQSTHSTSDGNSLEVVGGDGTGARRLLGAWDVTFVDQVSFGAEITSDSSKELSFMVDKFLSANYGRRVRERYAMRMKIFSDQVTLRTIPSPHSHLEGAINPPSILINAASISKYARSRTNVGAFGIFCRSRATPLCGEECGLTLYLIEVREEAVKCSNEILAQMSLIASPTADGQVTLRPRPSETNPPLWLHPSPIAASSPYPQHSFKGGLGRSRRYVNEVGGASPLITRRTEAVDDECCTLIDYSNSTTSSGSTNSVKQGNGVARGNMGGESSGGVADTEGRIAVARTSRQRTSVSNSTRLSSGSGDKARSYLHQARGSVIPQVHDKSTTTVVGSSKAAPTRGRDVFHASARPPPLPPSSTIKPPSAKVEIASTPASAYASSDHHHPITVSDNNKENRRQQQSRPTVVAVRQGRRRRRGPSPPHSTSPSPTEEQVRKGNSIAGDGASAPRRSSCTYGVELDRPPRPPSFKKPLARAQTSNNSEQDYFIMPGTNGADLEGGGGGALVAPQHNKAMEEKGADIERILKSESARAPFISFLQQQFCAENINFYLSVEEYRTIPENDVSRRVDFGRQIYDRHFAANCAEPVNIDNSTANGIREAYRMNRFTSDLYDLVQYQIFHLLKYDCWPRYLRANGGTVEELGGDSSHRGQSIASSSAGTKAVEQLRQFQCSAVTDRRENDPRRERDFNDDDDAEEEDGDDSRSASSTSRASLVDEPSSSSARRPLPQPLSPSSSALPRREPISRRKSFFRFIHRKVLHLDGDEAATESDLGRSTEVIMGQPVPLEPSPIGKRTRKQRCSVGNLLSVQQPTQPSVKASSQPRRFRSLNRRSGSKLPTQSVQSTADYHMPQRGHDLPAKHCTLLYGDSTNSMEIAITDQLQSVRQWTATAAEVCGVDGNASEVVDAQSGCTIDPARQAVDALNSRTVRIMPVVKFPVVFLAPSGSSQQSKQQPPVPAKVVILRSRLALTVGKVLRPIMVKYNVDPDQAVVCVAGSCDVVKMPTPISTVYQKTLTVLSTHQQFAERKLLAKKETQKELTLVPAWMTSSSSNPEHQLPFHQHGDVAFCEVAIDQDGKGGGLLNMKYSATRSYSSNPREFFKFGRKASHAKNLRGEGGDGSGGDEGGSPASVGSSHPVGSHPGGSGLTSSFTSHLRHGSKSGGALLIRGGSDRRKSLGAQTGGPSSPSTSASTSAPTTQVMAGARGSTAGGGTSPLAVGLVAPSDIPYCGEDSSSEVASRSHAALYPTKSAIPSTSSGCAYEMPDFLKQASSSGIQLSGSGGGAAAPDRDSSQLPPIYASTIRSDKETALTPSETIESGLAWQKADYV